VLAVTLVFTAAALAWGAWLVLTGTGIRTQWGWWIGGLAVVSFGLELAYAAIARESWVGPVMFLLITVFYVGLIGILRRHYWSEARKIAAVKPAMRQFRAPFLIINPHSGDGRALKSHLAQWAERLGTQVHLLQPGETVEQVAREAVGQGADVLGISGGDGSIGAVAGVAIEHDVPVVVLAGGTRCHFAKDLGLSPERLNDGLAGFAGIERRVDVAEINGRTFVNNVSFGVYGDIVGHAEYRQHKLAAASEVLGGLVRGERSLYDLRFRHGYRIYQQAAMVLVGVNRYETWNLLELGRRHRLDEGVLQVTALTRLDDDVVKGLVTLTGLASIGGGMELADCQQWTTAVFRLASADDQIVVGIDGESVTVRQPATITLKPQALRLLVPAAGTQGRQRTYGFMAARRIAGQY
jgi:diacylglycerol kinase family enzyme